MTFDELKTFLISKMRMNHIYQPLLIKSLLESGGTSTIRQMAITFLAQDESLILEYEDILKKMPIKVLTRHSVITRKGDLIELETKKLTLEQKAELKKICEEKLQQYVASRGMSIWDYRLLDTEPVPDSIRFRVLKDADFESHEITDTSLAMLEALQRELAPMVGEGELELSALVIATDRIGRHCNND